MVRAIAFRRDHLRVRAQWSVHPSRRSQSAPHDARGGTHKRTGCRDGFFIIDQVREKFGNFSRVHWWSDGGPHFKSYKFLGGFGVGLFERSKTLCSVSYGPEYHFKNVVDGLFGELDRQIHLITKVRPLKTVPDLVEQTQLSFQRPPPGKECSRTVLVYDWMPRPKAQVKTMCLNAARLPRQLQSTYCWHFTKRMDDRRVGVWGAKSLGMQHTATALYVSAAAFPGADWTKRVHPEVLPAKELAAEPAVPEPAVDDSLDEVSVLRAAGVTLGTKEWEGWRLYYRSSEPEKVPAAVLSARLRQRMAKMSGDMRKLPVAFATHSEEELKQQALKTRAEQSPGPRAPPPHTPKVVGLSLKAAPGP